MTNKRTFQQIFSIGLSVALCLLMRSAYAEDPAALSSRLNSARASNSIDDPGILPWYLKLSFQLFDAKGKPGEQGTAEEWWNGPSSYKTVYTSPSYSSTELHTKDGVYRSKNMPPAPPLLELILQQVVHPAPSEADIAASKPELHVESFGKAKLDCIMLGQNIEGLSQLPMGLFSTYCFDPGNDVLRAVYEYGSQMTIRNRIGTFQTRSVPIDQETDENSIKAVTAHIEILKTISGVSDSFEPSPDLEKADTGKTDLPAGVFEGHSTYKPAPVYPALAKQNGVSGSVKLEVLIGRDGRVHKLKVVSAPAPDLAIAALTAVRQWRYTPYLLQGKPVDVETIIVINFSIAK